MTPAEHAQKLFKIIYVELTNACNFTCDYCPIDEQTRPKVVMPKQQACDVLDQIADNDLTDLITFHVMGEPYLHKELSYLTGYAEERGLRVRLLTNGSLLEEERNRQLFENQLSRLEVGFRTPNEKSFDLRLRRIGALTLDEYVSRVEGLIEAKIRLQPKTEICIKFFVRSHSSLLGIGDAYTHLTSKEDNLGLARRFQRYALETAKQHGHSTADWDEVPIRIQNGEYAIYPGISVAFTRIQDFWVREQKGAEGKPQRSFPARVGGCSAGFRDDFGILANGDVTTCCVDYDGRNVIGNLQDHSLVELLRSDEAKRIRRSFERFVPATPFCRECLGGPTRSSSVLKQAASVAIDVRDRLNARKSYRKLRHRLNTLD